MEGNQALVRDLVSGCSPLSIQQDATVGSAARFMGERNIGSLVVVDEDEHVVGIVSERDIVRRLAADGRPAATLHVADIMTRDVAVCELDAPLAGASETMVSRHIRHLPVVTDGKLASMLSSRDIMTHQLNMATAMRDSAEQVAHWIKYLRSLDIEQLVEMVGTGVPGIFHAARSAVHVIATHGGDESVYSHRHECPHADEPDGGASDEFRPSEVVVEDRPATPCQAQGCTGRRLLLPLGAQPDAENESADACQPGSYLCMCGLPEAGEQMGEPVLNYKGTLMQDILSATLNNAVRYEVARRRGRTDALTGLAARRVFEQRLAEEFERSTRYGGQFCLAVIDVDFFKTVNDTCGHLVGDDILQSVAELLRINTRATDLPARYGGDEFVVILPEVGADGALVMLERFREAVASTLALPNGDAVTISCGLAPWEADLDQTPADLFSRTDNALYESKQKGRNCVSCAVGNSGQSVQKAG